MTEIYKLTKYVGSKSKVLDKIYWYFPKQFDVYLEWFGGSYTVPLNLKCLNDYRAGRISRSSLPLICVNDLDNDIAALAWTYTLEPHRLYEALRLIIHHQGLHRKLQELVPQDNFQQAIRFLYLTYTSFSGKLQSFSYDKSKATHKVTRGIVASFHYAKSITGQNAIAKSVFTMNDAKNFVYEIMDRLACMQSFNEDYKDFVARFIPNTTEKVFCYIDPPYYGLKDYKTVELNHQELYKTIKNLPANFKWVLSYNDVPEVRALYKDYHIFEEEWKYSVMKVEAKNNEEQLQGKELIITNFDPYDEKPHVKAITSFVH